MSPLALWYFLVSVRPMPFLSLININDLEFLYLPLFSHQDLIPKLSTKTHAPIHSAEAFWEFTADGASWRLFGVRSKNHLLGQLKFPAHEMQERSGVPQNEEDGISHLLCMSPKACIPMKVAPLPFFLSPPSEWGAHEKLTLCQSLHLSFSPSLPSSGNSATNSAPAFQLTKVLFMPLHVYRYTEFDRWTISSTNSNPPSPILDSATLLCNVNFLIPDFFL